jgi:hypothetical protein
MSGGLFVKILGSEQLARKFAAAGAKAQQAADAGAYNVGQKMGGVARLGTRDAAAKRLLHRRIWGPGCRVRLGATRAHGF